MNPLVEHEEVFLGKDVELRITSEGLALLPRGKSASAPLAARFDEVEHPAVAERGRGLQVIFADNRPPWTIKGLPKLSAEWAFTLLQTGARRARLRREPIFSAALPAALLQPALDRLSSSELADPYLLGQAILLQVVWLEATDLHLQQEATTPDTAALVVLLRVNGELQEMARLPLEVGQRAVGAIKVAAGMPNYATGAPQTGRLALPVAGRTVEVRLTSLPTATGEKLTARLFDSAARPHDLDALGFEPEVLTAYRELLAAPQGCILLTGPSGSGKSTTLYASLEAIKRDLAWRHVATIEEPVEYILPQIQQTEVNREAGLDFAGALRVMLRQDPQVLMVGEIRDPETAEIAIQAGLTGHLIFSSVHAPSAVGVFARLVDLGVEPYLLTSAVSAVLSQRLVRTLCPACALPASPTPDELAAAGLTSSEGYTFRRAGGCEQCRGGYAGRTALITLLPVTDSLRQAVMDRRPVYEIERLAPQLPAGGLWEAGLSKVARGEVALEELVRVLGRREG